MDLNKANFLENRALPTRRVLAFAFWHDSVSMGAFVIVPCEISPFAFALVAPVVSLPS